MTQGRSAPATRRTIPARRPGFLRLTLGRFALCAGLDHRQRNTPASMIDRHHPHGHHITHQYDIIRTLDVTIGHLTDMDQAAVLEPDIDEGAKIDNVEYRTLQFH